MEVIESAKKSKKDKEAKTPKAPKEAKEVKEPAPAAGGAGSSSSSSSSSSAAAAAPASGKKRSRSSAAAAVQGPLAIIAQPLAEEKLCKHVLKAVKKAATAKNLRRGVKEVVKAIRKGEEGCVHYREARLRAVHLFGNWRTVH